MLPSPITNRKSEIVEVGWILAGPLDAADAEAAEQARDRVLDGLSRAFADFDWQMPLLHRREWVQDRPAEPALLLSAAEAEREARQWDFALVVTDADLQSYYKPYALAAPSRAVSAAVLSTARLDPAATQTDPDHAVRVQVMTRRLFALALHLFGHLNDLPHSRQPSDFMYAVKAVDDLDRMQQFSEEAHRALLDALLHVADLRLEETGRFRDRTLPFYLRAIWENGHELLRTVWRVRPWQFPFRLSRLTTAAVSTMLVLIITAEAWELGMSQPPGRVLVLSLGALLGASAFILKRQQLILRRHGAGLTEQRVVTNVSMVIAVLLGMGTTYAMLFGATLAFSLLLFPSALVTGWAASLNGTLEFGRYLALAGFVAALGILIGALGASFEARGYFRHVAYVDEET